jgi:hypothetical protein
MCVSAVNFFWFLSTGFRKVYTLDLKTLKYIEKLIARDMCISFFSTVLFENICNYIKCLAETQA